MQYFPGGVIDRFESVYAVLGRFQADNALPGSAFRRLFRTKSYTKNGVSFGLEDLRSVNYCSLQRIIGLSRSQLLEMFLVPCYLLGASLICPYLRFCPICIGARRHYAIFQLEQLAACPFHSVQLRTTCAVCNNVAIYDWTGKLFDVPFCCAHCEVPLGAKQGRVCFFDVYTAARSYRIDRVYAALKGVVPIRYKGSSGGHEACVGFLVYGLNGSAFEQWQSMVELPLQGLGPSDVDWLHSLGYVQIRGPSPGVFAQDTGELSSVRVELVARLKNCLKSILRNLRQSWGLRRQCSSLTPAERELQRFRKQAYRLLQQHWWGFSNESVYRGGGPHHKRVMSNIDAFVGRHWAADCRIPCPAAVQAWLMTHRFCGQVIDWIGVLSQLTDCLPGISDDLLLEKIAMVNKPLWLVALITPNTAPSYRVVRHYKFPACLWSLDLWGGS